MKNIIEFLKKNGIDYKKVAYGKPYYYNDGFSVQAIQVTFDYELADDYQELKRKEQLFLQSMKRRKNHCIGYSGKCGICIPWYSVFNVFDFKMQQDHEARIQADVEKFWQEEHARRESEKLMAVI